MQRRKLVQAYHKYTPEKMIVEKIASTKNLEDAKFTEIQLIQQYDSYNNGYNMTLGGDHAQVKDLSEADLDNIRDLLENTDLTLNKIGRKFKVSASLVSMICANKIYEGIGEARIIRRGSGSYARGENSGNSKFTEKDVINIKKSYIEGKSSQIIAKEFKTSRTQICDILNEKIWKGVGPKVEMRKFRGNSKLTENQVRECWELKLKNKSTRYICDNLNLKYHTVYAILSGTNWKDLYDEYNKKAP